MPGTGTSAAGVVQGLGTGRAYRVGYYPAATWYCQGPTDALLALSASTQALRGTLWAPLRTPGLLALNMPLWANSGEIPWYIS